MKKDNYTPVAKNPGIYKHSVTGKFQARLKLKGQRYKESFSTLYEAKLWKATFDGKKSLVKTGESEFPTLQEVWEKMQKDHFTTLADSTQEIWKRRFTHLRRLEHLPMDKITPGELRGWVSELVKEYRDHQAYQAQRGLAGRSNLDNELNLLVTVFNWFTTHKDWEHLRGRIGNPVLKELYEKGFIKPTPVRNMSLSLDSALKFFQYLKQPYRDLALIQYFTASRIGEAAGLQWSRINFEQRTILIMETCHWDLVTKMFVKLNKMPKNKTPRPVYMTKDLEDILRRLHKMKKPGCNFVFHIEGEPLNYCTIQVNYRQAQKISGIPQRGTHILRHGMAQLARKIGGLDAVIAMTGHKDLKLADHYSKLDSEFQKETSIKIMNHIRNASIPNDFENVIQLSDFAKAE